jgi:hypothetical protein
MKKAHAYNIAGFTIGIDTDMSNHLRSSDKTPEATCFIVDSEDFHMQKLFSSYAAFTPKSIDHVRKLLSLIVHIESDATMLHAALTIHEKGNILLLGQSRSGKSTLSGLLGQIIDDDILIYRNELLYVPSINGYTATGRSPDKELLLASENVQPLRPDYCFILDKSESGGFIEETDMLPLDSYMPNYFSKDNTTQYIEHNNFIKPEWLPAYIIGTNGNIEKTLESIQKTI